MDKLIRNQNLLKKIEIQLKIKEFTERKPNPTDFLFGKKIKLCKGNCYQLENREHNKYLIFLQEISIEELEVFLEYKKREEIIFKRMEKKKIRKTS